MKNRLFHTIDAIHSTYKYSDINFIKKKKQIIL